MLAGHERDYRMWRAFGKLGEGPGSPTFFTLGQRFTKLWHAPDNEWLKDYSYEIVRKIADTAHTVVLEDLNTKAMTKSAKGTVENPGRNVK